MSGIKTLQRTILLIFVLGAFALSQSNLVVVRDGVATFTLRDGGTVWDIWTENGNVPWATFYDATAALNPEESGNRFTSIPIGSLISVPTSVLQAGFASLLPTGEAVIASEVSVLSGQVEDLRAAVLLQNSSIQSVSASVENLASAVETFGAALSESVPPVVSTSVRDAGLTSEQWLLLGSMLTNLLVFLTLVTLIVLYLREQKKLRAVIRDFQHYPVVVPRTRDEERDLLELRLHRENRELRESTKALEDEKKGLKAQITSYVRLLAENKSQQERIEILNSIVVSLEDRLALYEESPEHSPALGGQKTRRGTHGSGRRYKS